MTHTERSVATGTEHITIDPKTVKTGDVIYAPSDGRWGGSHSLPENVPLRVQNVKPRLGGRGVVIDFKAPGDHGPRTGYGFEWFRPLEKGALVRVTTDSTDPHYRGHEFKKGEVARFRRTAGHEQVEAEYLDGNDGWYLGLHEFKILTAEVEAAEQEVEAVARPTIDFSLSRYATARQYAADLTSPSNKEETNAILSRITDGYTVDVVEPNAAITDALRRVANRGRSSSDRRDLARKAAHLGHIVQATIENHVDQLPAYEVGQRSRLLEEVKSSLRVARDEVVALTGSVESERAESQRLSEQIARDLDKLSEVITARDTAEHDRDVLASTLDYALGLLDEGQKQRVFGFRDGVEAGDGR